MNRERYEEDLRRRQEEHLRRVRERYSREWHPCSHDNCHECIGTGVKSDGSPCVHMISCHCPRCTPYTMVCS